jgi:hypothetical protein
VNDVDPIKLQMREAIRDARTRLLLEQQPRFKELIAEELAKRTR